MNGVREPRQLDPNLAARVTAFLDVRPGDADDPGGTDARQLVADLWRSLGRACGDVSDAGVDRAAHARPEAGDVSAPVEDSPATDRRRAEDALRESEEKYRALFESTGEAICTMDADGVYLLMNATAAARLGGSPADFVGKTMWDAFPKAVADRQAATVRRVIESGRGEVVESSTVLQGEQRWYRTNVEPIRNNSGAVTSALVFAREVTAQRQADERLRRSELLYRTAIDSMSDMIHVVGRDLRFQLMNATLCSWCVRLGLPTGYEGRDVFGLFPFLPETVRDQYEQVFTTGVDLVTTETTTIDGQAVTTETRKIPIRSEGGVDRVLTVMRDVTKRKRVEQDLTSLLKQLADFRETVNRSPAVVLRRRVADDWPVEFVSENVVQFGYSATEFLEGQVSWPGILHADDVSRLEAEVERHLTRGAAEFRLEYRLLTRAGEERWVEDRNKVLRDARGRATHVEGIVLDTTEQKRMAHALHASHEQLRSLAARLEAIREEERARLAHQIHDELGHELTALKMDLSWLLRALARGGEGGLPAGAVERTRAMIRSVDQTIQSVRQLATNLRPPVLDLGLAAAIEWQTQEFGERTGIRCRLTCDSDANQPELDGKEATTVFRVFQEVLTNVARHSRASGVDVLLATTPEAVHLRVVDSGKGISPEETWNRGSLGIVGIRERIQLLGGSVSFTGVPGEGTTVEVLIPVGAAAGGDGEAPGQG